ncbi:MAG: hypothetical protein ACYDCC_11755 [Actinomycetota bacterium]
MKRRRSVVGGGVAGSAVFVLLLAIVHAGATAIASQPWSNVNLGSGERVVTTSASPSQHAHSFEALLAPQSSSILSLTSITSSADSSASLLGAISTQVSNVVGAIRVTQPINVPTMSGPAPSMPSPVSTQSQPPSIVHPKQNSVTSPQVTTNPIAPPAPPAPKHNSTPVITPTAPSSPKPSSVSSNKGNQDHLNPKSGGNGDSQNDVSSSGDKHVVDPARNGNAHDQGTSNAKSDSNANAHGK